MSADPELPRLLAELPDLRLRAEDWAEVERLLAAIEAGRGERAGELSQVVFEARVRRSFAGPKATSDVVPTKQTSALPVVGAVCGGLLVAVGALLGGGWILVGIAVLGALVFAVAFAGSRVAHRATGAEDDTDQPVAIPDQVAARIEALDKRVE